MRPKTKEKIQIQSTYYKPLDIVIGEPECVLENTKTIFYRAALLTSDIPAEQITPDFIKIRQRKRDGSIKVELRDEKIYELKSYLFATIPETEASHLEIREKVEDFKEWLRNVYPSIV